MRSSRTLLLPAWLCAIVLCSLGPALLQGQTPSATPVVDEARLPLEKLTPELLSDRVPVRLEEYQALRRAAETAKESPSATRLLKAEYEAKYVDHRLADGRFVWTLHNATGKPRTRSMESLGVPVKELKWGDQPAVWGTSPAGNLEVLMDRVRGDLSGRWELNGKTIGEHDEFVLQVPPAAVSHITLLVPTGHTVIAAGQVLTSTAAAEGMTSWRIGLGGRTECRIVIHPPQPAEVANPLILVQDETLYALRQEGLRFRAELRLEVTNSAVREIPIWADPDLEIFSVTYGNDIPLPWQTSTMDGRQRLLVKLPDELLGTGRTLRLRGVAPLKTDVEWKLPTVAIAGAALVDGQAVLQLSPPLQLQQLTSTGYRQIAVETNAARDDVLTFKQFRTDGVLSIKLGKPRPRIRARVLSDVQTQTSEWSCSTQLQLTGTDGAAFVVDCRIPAGWDVLDVRDPQGSKLDWNVITSTDGMRLLSMQFLEALTPEKLRIIEIDARRSVGTGDQTIAVPAFEPLQPRQSAAEPRVTVDDLAMLVAVNSSPDVQPVLDSGSSFEDCKPVDLETEWTSSKFWKTPLADRSAEHVLLLRLNGPVPEGAFSLQSLQTPIEVNADVKIEVADDKITKSIKLAITPRRGTTERVLVYLSELGPQFSWTLTGPTPQPVVARKLDVIHHPVWGCPTSGELLELRLPQAQSAPFELVGVRVRGLTPTGRLGLVFVPQAPAFHGRVTLQAPADLGLDLSAWNTDSEGILSATGSLQERTWTWHSAAASLRYQTRVANELTPAAVIRRVAIQARWGLQPYAHDYYVADLELGSGFHGRELQCTLPGDVEITEIKVDGQTIPFAHPTGGAPLTLNNLADEQLVTVVYRAASPGLLRPSRRTLVLPKLEIPVLRCDVELLTPSGFRLGNEPRGMMLKSSTPSISTLQRLFGPLGRSSREVFFNPLSPLTWAQSWSNPGNEQRQPDSDGADSESLTIKDELFIHDSIAAPERRSETGPSQSLERAGWQVWRGSAAILPDRIEVWLWSNRQATGTAWLGFWAALLIGMTLRLLGVSPRGGLGVIALTIELLLALVLPSVLAQIAGACLAGTLLAVLWPQHLIKQVTAARGDEQTGQQHVPQGSTRSYVARGSVVVSQAILPSLLGLILLSNISVGLAQPQAAPTGASPSAATPRVVIPVDGENRPLGKPPLAYVPERLVSTWRAIAAGQNVNSEWLLKSGEYILRRDASQRVDFTARYEVTVLSEASEVDITIPLTGVNFGGPQACLVDGKPHSILTRPDSNLLVVRLPGVAPTGPPPPPMPESADAPASAATWPVPVRSYRIEFHGYPVLQSVAKSQWMELEVPRLHAAVWTFQNDHPEAVWTNRMGDTAYTVAARQSWSRELGPVAKVRVESTPASSIVDPVLDARLALLADVHPAVAQLHYQVTYRVVQGEVSKVTWQLPVGMAVRGVSGPEVFDWHLVPAKGGTSLLHIDLQSPVSEGFQVKVEALLPNDGPPSQLTIPPIQLLTPKEDPLRPSRSLVGIRASSEFQPEAPPEGREQIAPSAVDDFVNEWGSMSIGVKPQVAYSLLDPVALKVGLRPLLAQRVVRMTSVGVLGSRRLQWNLNATIEVQSAAAYSHQLEIDPRLSVTSVSIQEDAANRLLRWTRAGDTLHVFLRDKTTGTQTLSLQGTMPTQVPQELVLPTIKFADATVADSRLQLYQEPDLEVEVTEPDKWVRLEIPSELRLGAARNPLVGRFQWPLDNGPFVVSMKQNEPVLTYSAVTSLQSRNGRWKMTTNFLFEVKHGHGSQFSIRVPSEIPPPVKIGEADVRQVFEREADGSQRILLYPRVPVRGRFAVQVTNDVNLPASGTAVIPEVVGLNAARTEHFVVLPADANLTVDPRTSALTLEPMPAELAKQLPTELQGTVGHQYRGHAGAWIVNLASPHEQTPQSGVLWSETQIWCGSGAQVAGRTSLLLGPQDGEHVDLRIPAGTELQGVLLDGEFIPHGSLEEHLLRIPLTFPQAGHALTVFWTMDNTLSGKLYHQAEFYWPRIAGSEVREQYVTLTPPPGFRAQTTQGNSVERTAVQLSELQAVLQLMQQQAGGGSALNDPQWMSLHRHAANLIKRLQSDPRLESGRGDQAERFAQLQAQFLPWEQSIPAIDPVSEPDLPGSPKPISAHSFTGIEGNFAGPHSLLIRLPANASGMRLAVSVIDEAVWRWMLGLSLSGLLLCVAWPLLRSSFRTWLTSHPTVAWTVLGFIWWCCLTPSWLGMIWLAMGVVYLMREIWRWRVQQALAADEPQSFIVAASP